MAHFVYLFVLLVTLLSSCLIEARFGKFYDELPNSPSESPSPSPSFNGISQPPSVHSFPPAPCSKVENSPASSPCFEGIAPAPIESEMAPTPVESTDNAYGLYGSSDFSNEVFNKKKTTNHVVLDVVDDDENQEVQDVQENGFNNERFKEVNSYNSNGYNNLPSTNNYFKNGGVGESYNDNNNGGFNDKYNDNGKYYYDVQDENTNQNEGYGSVKRDGNNGGRTKYEFDSMDEYEREQGCPNDQKYYVP